ncbi:MAG: AmmeMemoRadiSam system protein B [Planctomycetota bacterium]|nr:AmmeMemoRadiSam system protein B [Planctomycetota bacterium]
MTETTLPEHINRPHVRPFQGMPIEHKESGQTLVGLRNPSGITTGMVAVHPNLVQLISMMQGELTLAELAAKTKAPLEALTQLAQRLDEAGLVWGPTMEGFEKEMLREVRELGAIPLGAAGSFGADADKARETMSALLAAAEDAELGESVLGIVAPHLDLARGGSNYGAAYKSFEGLAAPDRVVVLGTNHFGLGDGVVMTRLGFDTPLGRVLPDESTLAALENYFGDKLFKDEIDIVAEHSIQLHTPWIKHLFPNAMIVAALLPDPTRAMIDESGARATTAEFAAVLRDILAKSKGRTLVISSADLSHIGPPFGDPALVDDARRSEVETFDRAMIASYCSQTADEFLKEMRGHNNVTRWCSLGNMWAARTIVDSDAELLQYQSALEPSRATMVSSAAIALVAK